MSSRHPEISVGMVDASHCADLADLIHRAFAAYRGRLVPESGAHAETPATLAAALGKGAAFQAVASERPVGCLFTEVRPDSLYLGRLAVDPSWRGRGIGATLLAAAESRAREMGLARMELGVRLVLLDNIRLFQRAGFVILRQECHPGFTEPTFHVMEKQVSPSP